MLLTVTSEGEKEHQKSGELISTKFTQILLKYALGNCHPPPAPGDYSPLEPV